MLISCLKQSINHQTEFKVQILQSVLLFPLCLLDMLRSCICHTFETKSETPPWTPQLSPPSAGKEPLSPTPVEPQPHEKHCDCLWTEDLWFLNVYGYICSGEWLSFFFSFLFNLFYYCHEFVHIHSGLRFFQDVQLAVICILLVYGLLEGLFSRFFEFITPADMKKHMKETLKLKLWIDCGCDAVTSLQHTASSAAGAFPTFE